MVLAASGAILVGSLMGFRGLHFSHAPIEWLAEDNHFRVATQLTDARMGGTINLEVLVDTGRPNGMQDPGVLRKLDALQAGLDGFEQSGLEVGKSLSLADTIQEIHQALNENRPEFYTVPEDRRLVAQELLLFENTGSDDLTDVVDPSFQVGRVTLRAPFGDAIAYTPFLERVKADFEEVLGGGVNVHFTGLMPIMSGTIRAMSRSLAFSYSLAFVVISVLMVLMIGSLKLGLFAMIPNVAPIVIVLGAIGFSGHGLDIFTMLIGSIAIGLAVDDTIHFMHNFKRHLDEHGDPRRAVAGTLATAGQAMLFTTLVLSTGFAIFMFSSMSVLTGFGLAIASSVVLAFLADVLLAPALMTWLVEDSR
jgi:predicted RND superfamily exporter protein